MFDSIWSSPPGRLARGGATLVVLAGYLILSGCGSINVNDTTPNAPSSPGSDQVAPALPSGAWHDLSIMGVDFDPALTVPNLLRHTPMSLIVGVSNQGNTRESAVRVTADLWSADGSQKLLHSQQTVDSIAAGDVLPVRLTSPGAPPVLSHYQLTVQIVAVPGETSVQNNSRTLDITVNADDQ